ncbi:MAG: hypothetical protein IJM96_03180 [Clostridia bacterium]|nr:hypothetical protein [Oscillospiraceae bacterium]MBQ6932748.1 hypothetical protein [Clostridia bacterium]MBQ7086461.1 hypothetical protein [Clostridia bacterium]
MKQKRIKSPVLWSAIAAIALLVLRGFGFEDAAVMASTRADQLWDLICAAIAIFGVANNPTEGGKF